MIFFMKDDADIHSKIDKIGSHQNLEAFLYAEECLRRNINTYWSSLDNINYDDNRIKLYDLKNKQTLVVSIPELHKYSDILLFKTVGSIESKLLNIKKGMTFLNKHYKGTIINNPDTIIYGSNKNYLIDLQKNKFPIIPSDIFPNNISEKELKNSYKDCSKYLIKSATGELSNSLMNLSEIDENWLRRKENKVGGWIVQPIQNDVWNGEYQIVFFGDKLSHAQVKAYQKKNSAIPKQDERTFHPYNPSKDEIQMCLEMKQHIEHDMRKTIHYFRCDYFKNKLNKMSILEFEMVNPGFFLMYRERTESNKIAKNFIDYLLTKSR